MGCGRSERYYSGKILQDLVLKVKKPRIKVTDDSKVWLGNTQGKKRESAFTRACLMLCLPLAFHQERPPASVITSANNPAKEI